MTLLHSVLRVATETGRTALQGMAAAVVTSGLFLVPALLSLAGMHLGTTEVTVQPEPEQRVVTWAPPPPSLGEEEGDDEATEPSDSTAAPEPRRSTARSTPQPSGSTEASASSPPIEDEGRPVAARRATTSASTKIGPVVLARTAVGRTEGRGKAASGETGKRKRRCEEPTDRIERIDRHQYVVERGLVDEYASSIPSMRSLVGWVRRHEDSNGRVDGVQLGGMRCGSVLRTAGVRNRDVVHEVNGRPIKNLLQALLAWPKLRNAEVIEVDITRKGRPMRLVYRVT